MGFLPLVAHTGPSTRQESDRAVTAAHPRGHLVYTLCTQIGETRAKEGKREQSAESPGTGEYPLRRIRAKGNLVVGSGGTEPPTQGFSGPRSIDAGSH